MTGKFDWDAANNPVGQTIDQVLYKVRSNDKEGMIYDSLALADILDDSDGILAVFDALVTPYSRLERKVNQLRLVMDKAVEGVSTVSVQVSEPFKQNGSVHVAAVFELTDGQTASVIFHNPDSTPNKLAANDEMISWKWMLNKKDITIVVAPENGRDLAIREVGRRIMKLADKNSIAFARMNQKRAERLENIKGLTGEVEQLEATLSDLEKEIEKAKAEQAKRELEENEKPMIKQLFEKLVRNGWKLKNGHDDFLAKEEYSFGAKSNVVVDFNEFDTDKKEIEISAVGGGSKVMYVGTNDLAAEYDEFKVIIMELLNALHGSGVVDSLFNLLQNTYKMKCERLSPLEFNVTTPRSNSDVDIELNEDGTFHVTSSDLSVDHLQGEDSQVYIAKQLDELDFIVSQSAFDDDPELKGDVIQGGVFKGKTFDYAFTIEQIEIAVNSLSELSLVFGDFNHTAAAGGTLFDSIASESNPPVEGITAQIGYKPTDIIMARVNVDAVGNAIIYRGETGTVQEKGIDAPTSYTNFVPVFKRLIAELNKEPELEEKLPELKAYLETFTPLKRGQILKSLSRIAYNDDGAKVSVAENVISFAKRDGAKVDMNSKGERVLMDEQFILSSKLGKIPMNFGIWLIESGTVKTKVVAPKYADDFDPTTPQGYDLVKHNGDLEMFQDPLDAFFQGRYIAIRNALREIGWQGEEYGDLSKYGYTLVPDFETAGAGGNLVGLHFRIKDEAGQDVGFFMSSALGLSATEYADRLDMGIPKKPKPVDIPEPEQKSLEDMKSGFNLGLKMRGWSISENATGQVEMTGKSIGSNRELRALWAKDNVLNVYADGSNRKILFKFSLNQAVEKIADEVVRFLDQVVDALNPVEPVVDPEPGVDPVNEDDEINTFLKDVIANPGNHTGDESLDKLTEIAESLGDDETSEFATVVNQAAKAVQEVAFKQLQDMVSQG